MISKKVRKSLMEWNPMSDRLLTACYKSKVRNVTGPGLKEDFYEQLHTIVRRVRLGPLKYIQAIYT